MLSDKEIGERKSKFESLFIPEPNTGCHIWVGAAFSTPSGYYGTFRWNGKNEKIHRLVWFFVYGYFPQLLDHKCRVTLCGEIRHLEEVTNRVNILRGMGPSAINARKTHCARDHELLGPNLYSFQRLGRKPERQCKKCKLIGQNARRGKPSVMRL